MRMPPEYEEARILIEKAVGRLVDVINEADFEIRNEYEFFNLFFCSCCAERIETGIQLNQLRAQIPHDGGYIDFGIVSPVYKLFLELKAWIRPPDASGFSKRNAQTARRNSRVTDAKRLLQVIRTEPDRYCGGILICERNSSHLKCLLGKTLKGRGIELQEEWFPLQRPSQGDHEEHIGLIWIDVSKYAQGDI